MADPRGPGPESGGIDEELPSWRIPAYQPALYMLVVCGAAALNLYGHPSAFIRAMSIIFGVAALCLAVTGLREYLIVRPDGIAVRYVVNETFIPWAEFERAEVVHKVRGADTLRLIRTDRSAVNVPPALLQPSRVTSRALALSQLHGIATRLELCHRNAA